MVGDADVAHLEALDVPVDGRLPHGEDDVVSHLAVPDEAGGVGEGDLVELHPELGGGLDQAPHGLVGLQHGQVGRGREDGAHIVVIGHVPGGDKYQCQV